MQNASGPHRAPRLPQVVSATPDEPILVVEDNPQNLKLVKTVLEMEGYEVKSAEDAEQALYVLNTFQPSLILMDIQLPGMDGLQLTRLLRQMDKENKTIIIALTAYAMKGDKERFLSAGCDGYIPKPIDPNEFPQQIREYLDGHAS